MKRLFAFALGATIISPLAIVPALFIDNSGVQASLSGEAMSDLNKIYQSLELIGREIAKQTVLDALAEMRGFNTGNTKRTIDRMSNAIQGLGDQPEIRQLIEVIKSVAEQQDSNGDSVIKGLIPALASVLPIQG
tara:strand:+ start:86 stop:487 length:402 start_codon:yes stop_codon:yes gene_type:complete